MRYRRKELHDFLKAARARVQPKDLGLTPPRNRRSSGLQQADLAATLNVSPRWYNGFENGAAGANDEMLDRIARILQLAPAERLHLYLLATEHGPAPGTIEPPHGAEAVLTRLVRQMGDLAIPAVVTDVAWNMLVWNRALPTWFTDPGNVPLGDRNAVLWAFTPEIDSIVADIDKFRQHTSGGCTSPSPVTQRTGLRHLVDRLQRIPAARQLWSKQQIAKFTDSITPVRFRLADSASLVETDLLSTEFPGGFRLLMLVPCGRWPNRPPSRSRVIGHSISEPAADPRPHP